MPWNEKKTNWIKKNYDYTKQNNYGRQNIFENNNVTNTQSFASVTSLSTEIEKLKEFNQKLIIRLNNAEKIIDLNLIEMTKMTNQLENLYEQTNDKTSQKQNTFDEALNLIIEYKKTHNKFDENEFRKKYNIKTLTQENVTIPKTLNQQSDKNKITNKKKDKTVIDIS